jgi:hypothetical protein
MPGGRSTLSYLGAVSAIVTSISRLPAISLRIIKDAALRFQALDDKHARSGPLSETSGRFALLTTDND